jgi:hypothetical protein
MNPYGLHIRPDYLSAPIGKYLLVRPKDGQYGAIKSVKAAAYISESRAIPGRLEDYTCSITIDNTVHP